MTTIFWGTFGNGVSFCRVLGTDGRDDEKDDARDGAGGAQDGLRDDS